MVKKFDPIKLTDHLYQVGNPYFPGYLSMGEVNMLIDGGSSACASTIETQLNLLDINPQSIEYIAITHSHGDHIGALSRLKKKWPHVKTVASGPAAKMLSNPKVIQQFEGFDGAVVKNMQSASEIEVLPEPVGEEGYNFNVDIIADENTRIDLGRNISWTTTATPGHSSCQLAFFEAHEGTAAIGDAIGFYSPEKRTFWPNYFESLTDYVNSIKKIERMKAARLGLGHYGTISEDTSTFLADALAATRDYHEEMVERAGNGEDFKVIAQEKVDWMADYVKHMVFVVPMMCQLLIKLSLKAVEEGVPDFNL